MNQARKFAVWQGAAVSLALHACIVLPISIWLLHTPPVPYHRLNRLNVEVFGMIANRQTAAQQPRAAAPRPRPEQPTQQPKQPGPVALSQAPPSIEPPSHQIEPSTNAPEAVRLPPSAPFQHEDLKPPPAAAQAGADSQQPQQTIAAHNDMNDRIAAYMSQLTRHLQSNLIYPQDAKKKKIEGTPLVAFVIMESGEIQPNTLVVKRSSGNATLDASALRTVASSAPFLKPPRQLNVSVELEFQVDSKIF